MVNSSTFGPSDAAVGVLASRQGGHITRQQLVELGLDANAVKYRVAIGRLIRVHHGVYAVGHLPTNPRDRAHGALLATGPSTRSRRLRLRSLGHRQKWPPTLELISATDRRASG